MYEIISSSVYLPSSKADNDMVRVALGHVSDEDDPIAQKTGITSRHVAPPSDDTLAMAKRAVGALDVKGTDIDAVIYFATTSERRMPSGASSLHEFLGLKESCFTLDINNACCSFTSALIVSHALIAASTAQNVLVVGSELFSRLASWEDMASALFGDAAAAILIAKTSHCTCRHITKTLSAYNDMIRTDHSRDGGCELVMNGRQVKQLAPKLMFETITELLHKHRLTLEHVDAIFPHQANVRLLDKLAVYLNEHASKLVIDMEGVGNTGSVGMMIAYHRNCSEGRNVIFVGVGSGMVCQAVLLHRP